MEKHTLARKSNVLGLFAIAIWSFAAILAVGLTSIPPFEILFFQFLIGFFIVLVRFSRSKDKKPFSNFKKRDLFIAIAALIINQFFYYSAFQHAPAAHVDLVNYLWPTLLIIFSSLLPNEKLCPSYVIACILCLLGVYTLVSPGGDQKLSSDHFIGYFLALGSAVTWALYNLYSRYRGSAKSVNCISWACGPAALACLLIHLYFEKFTFPNPFEIALILVLGIFQIGLALYFWERGLKKGCVRFLALSSYSVPVFSVLILVLFGKADFEPRMITATLIISLSPLSPILAKKLKELNLQSIKQKQKTLKLETLKTG